MEDFRLQLRLISKLTLSTSVLLLLAMTLFAWSTIRAQRTMLLEETVLNTDRLSETIIKTTHYQMLENDRQRVYQTISEAGTQKEIERIRLITKDGRTIFSTDRAEIGTYLDKTAEACTMCHGGGKPLLNASTMNRSRIFHTRQGKEVLGLAKAIYNEEKCSTAACHFHPKESKILGVLDVIVSLDGMNAQLSTYRTEITALTMLVLGLTSLSLTLLTNKLINQPVKKLLRQTERIAEGQLEGTVGIESADEIGDLAASFNTMTGRLKEAREELEEWGKHLEEKVEQRTSELNRMQTQLIRSEKLASLGELVAGIAHEINNPLTGILVYSSLVKNDAKLDPDLRSDMDTVVRETERCAEIVRGLLEFSRESIPRKNWASLNDIMDAAVALMKHQSLFQNIIIAKNYDPRLPKVLVDANQIEQVFVNMLLNAGQAMPDGGSLTISTDTSEAGGHIRVNIADSGCGIPAENLGKIFDPFFTTKESKGTGLGLSVSYGIIENHGGVIEVESGTGCGTTFTIKLPLLQG